MVAIITKYSNQMLDPLVSPSMKEQFINNAVIQLLKHFINRKKTPGFGKVLGRIVTECRYGCVLQLKPNS